MSMTDPIADLLTRIRNASMARLDKVVCPKSTLKVRLLEILQEEGYIKGFKVVKNGSFEDIEVGLRYLEGRNPVILGIKRLSKPGLRQYVKHDQIPQIRNGMGTAILSTSQGVMTGTKAKAKGIGGELICSVW